MKIMSKTEMSVQLFICLVLAVVRCQMIRDDRRVPEDHRFLNEFQSSTPKGGFSDNDDVHSVPVRHHPYISLLNPSWIDYWDNKGIDKRSYLAIPKDDGLKEFVKSYVQSWAGKRSSEYIPRTRFYANGGKRNDRSPNEYTSDDREGKKRSSKLFGNWSGKRGNSFKNWAG